MKRLCCYLGYGSKVGVPNRRSGAYPEHQIADLSEAFRNNPFPSIDLVKVSLNLYPLHKQLEVGQLFYLTQIEIPGSIQINIEALDILEYPHILNGMRLFAKSGNSANYSNLLRNLTLNKLQNYYDSVIIREIRNKKIDIITKDEGCDDLNN